MKINEKNTSNPSMIKGMFEAGAHFGYSRSRRHPSARSVLFGMKNGTDLIDLEKTYSYLTKTLDVIKDIAAKNKKILFVGTKPEARGAVEKVAEELSLPFVANKWVGGTLTNFSEIKKRVERMKTLKAQKERGDLDVYSKKERRDLENEIARLTKNFIGIIDMERLPDMMFVVDPRHEDTAVKEAKNIGIAIVAIANSDCNLNDVDYPIPANDGSRSSILFFLNQIRDAYKEGTKEREIKEAKNIEENTEGKKEN